MLLLFDTIRIISVTGTMIGLLLLLFDAMGSSGGRGP